MGEAEIAKAGAAVTVRATADVCVVLPPVPVTVIVYEPAATVEATAIVMVELPDPGAEIEVGLNPTVVPDGTPEADRLIELLKPLLMLVVIVDAPWLPWVIVRLDGEAAIVKLPLAVTVSVVVPDIDPDAALIVVVPIATPVA